jgi:hypothetical protein
MKVFDSTTRAYRLDGNVVSEESIDIVLNAAYAMLANNDEIAPPFDEWDEEEINNGEDTQLCYFTVTDTGKEIRVSFSFKEMTAKIMLISREEECFIGDNLLCTIKADKKYDLEEWL